MTKGERYQLTFTKWSGISELWRQVQAGPTDSRKISSTGHNS